MEAVRAGRLGQKRTEQFVVKDAAPLVEEVTEEEYQRIVEERKETAILAQGGVENGYSDTGCEIWEQKGADTEKGRAPGEVARAEARENLQNAFAAGAAAEGPNPKSEPTPTATASAPPANGKLADVLQKYCAGLGGQKRKLGEVGGKTKTAKKAVNLQPSEGGLPMEESVK